MSRTVFRIHFYGPCWVARVEGRIVDVARTKAALLNSLALRCGWMWDDARIESQIVIHGRDGHIQSERTYGNDPARRKG